MSKPKKTISVSKVVKGSYKVKLLKKMPARRSKEKPKVVDAIPFPVVGYAEVLADGLLGDLNKNVSVLKLSTGYYEVEFLVDELVASVVVQVHRAPRSLRGATLVQPFLLSRHRSTHPMKVVAVAIVTSKGEPLDRLFAIMAVKDGSLVAGKKPRKGAVRARS